MSRLKTFGKYLLMFVAFYIFVTVASIGFIKGTYETMEQNVYSSDEIQIEVEEAKSTFVNGYVKGKLTNNSDSDIHSKYVKINLSQIVSAAHHLHMLCALQPQPAGGIGLNHKAVVVLVASHPKLLHHPPGQAAHPAGRRHTFQPFSLFLLQFFIPVCCFFL